MKKLLSIVLLLALLPIYTFAEQQPLLPVDLPNLTVSGSEALIVTDFALVKQDYSSQLIIAFTNISDEIIPDAEIQIIFYDSDENVLGIENDGHDVILPKSTVITQESIYSDSILNYSSVEVIIDTEKYTNSYVNHASNLDIRDNVSDGKVFLQVSNKDTVEIAEIEIVVVFYKDGQIVGATEEEITHLAVDKKEVMQFYGFDAYEADSYTIYINQAHTWS